MMNSSDKRGGNEDYLILSFFLDILYVSYSLYHLLEMKKNVNL